MTFAEFMDQQRVHYARILADAERQAIEAGAEGGNLARILQHVNALLNADLERVQREAQAFFDRGGRSGEALH